MELGTLSALALAARASVLERVIEAIEAEPPIEEAAFADAVGALVLSGVRGTEIARRLGVESSCITRWTKNGATPHPTGRKVYARHLPRIARDHLATLHVQMGVATTDETMAEAA